MASKTTGAARTLTIENQAITAVYEDIPLDKVRLDPDNPRTRQQLGKVDGNISQDELQKLILDISGVSTLFRAIRENKGLHEPIYVRANGLVVEGNCRTAIYRKLREAQKKEACWQTIPALRLPANITERQVAVLQGFLHVAGKITWRAHEQAGHLYHMHTALKMKPAEIAAAIGLNETEVGRLIQAYETMCADVLPRIKDGDGRKKFSYVLEFYKNRKLADFRKSKQNVKLFTDLVVKEKLKQGNEVRQLHKILGSDSATDVLKDDGFAKAIALVGKSDPTADSPIFRKLTTATNALKSTRGPTLDRIRKGSKEKQILKDLYAALKSVAELTGVKLA